MSGVRSCGFLGLGAMGGPMAANLVKSQFRVVGFDPAPPALAALEPAGGHRAATPAEAAKGQPLLVVMAATPSQVEAALFGPDGAVAALAQGATVVLHSTVPPAFVEELAAKLAALGHPLLDAPVSGGQKGAQAGALTIMASGAPEAFAAAEGELAAVSQRVFRLGDRPGAGAIAKIAHQLLAGAHIVVAAEAMAMATRAGIDPRLFFEIVTASAGNSWMFQNRVPHMLEGDYTPLSAVEIFVKDLGIVLEAGRALRFPLPMAAAAHQQFLAAAGAGHGREDDAAVVKVYETLARIDVAEAAKQE